MRVSKHIRNGPKISLTALMESMIFLSSFFDCRSLRACVSAGVSPVAFGAGGDMCRKVLACLRLELEDEVTSTSLETDATANIY